MIVILDAKGTGENIRRLMGEKDVTVKEVSEMMGYTRTAVYKWLDGKTMPSLDSLVYLSDILDTRMDDIVIRRTVG